MAAARLAQEPLRNTPFMFFLFFFFKGCFFFSLSHECFVNNFLCCMHATKWSGYSIYQWGQWGQYRNNINDFMVYLFLIMRLMLLNYTSPVLGNKPIDVIRIRLSDSKNQAYVVRLYCILKCS